jgi:Rhs element Vgr protein
MADVRALPIASAHRELTVKVGGRSVPREHQLLQASLILAVNRIATARLAYLDGAAASSDFPLSGSDVFKPGQTIEVLAGAGGAQDSLFAGVVVRQSVRVRDNAAPQLIVECRHAAMKLTVTRRSRNYFESSDSEVIEQILRDAHLDADVEAISYKHPQLVQFHAYDWDFLLARAQANGKLVWPDKNRLVVKAPSASAAPVCALQFGATLLEFDAELDARSQFAVVESETWDPAQQSTVKVTGVDSKLTPPGNLSASDLAGVAAADRLSLKHAALTETEAQAWADAEAQRSAINRITGRGKCEGIGAVKPGDVVKLGGVGARFNGNAFVTAIRHEFDLVQGWKSHIQFGGVELLDATTMMMPAAGGLLPGVVGLHTGVVVSNEDPAHEHRVRVRLPLVASDDGVWARVASLDAGADRGFFFRPEIGDEVIVGFLHDDPRQPVILGMLHSSAKAAPLPGSDDNHEKLYKSRAGMRLHFDDDKKVLTIDTPSGNALVLSEDDKSLTLADQNGNKIVMNADGIALESVKALKLKAKLDVGMESGTSFNAKGGTELKLEGGAQAELSSSAVTALKGAIVQIN